MTAREAIDALKDEMHEPWQNGKRLYRKGERLKSNEDGRRFLFICHAFELNHEDEAVLCVIKEDGRFGKVLICDAEYLYEAFDREQEGDGNG